MLDFKAFVRGKESNILFCEVDERITQAARKIKDEGLANPILVGDEAAYKSLGTDLTDIQIIPIDENRFAQEYFELRKQKGITYEEAKQAVADPAFFSCMLIKAGEADGLVCGASWPTAHTLRAGLHILRKELASSFFVMKTPQDGNYLFADCAFNVNPTDKELAQIAMNTSKAAEKLGFHPHVAFLSFSTEGSAHHKDEEKVVRATQLFREILKEKELSWPVAGSIQLDAAIDPETSERKTHDSQVFGRANVLVFPNLDAGNIGYKLVREFAHAKAIGPIIVGFSHPVNDLSRDASVEEIVDVCCITAWQALTESS